MGDVNKPTFSFVAIVLSTILCFPVAFVLLILRLVDHRNKANLRVLDYILFRNILWTFFGLGLCSYFLQLVTGNKPLFSVLIAFILLIFLPGLYLHNKSDQVMKAIIERCAQYKVLIYEQGITSLQMLSAAVNKKPLFVAHDLKYLSAIGQLPAIGIVDKSDQIQLFETYSVPNSSASYTEYTDPSMHQQAGKSQAQHSDNHAGSHTENHTGNHAENYAGDFADDNSSNHHANESQMSNHRFMAKTIICEQCGAPVILQPGEKKSCEFCNTTMSIPK